ncbi:MAG: hypothetical protein R6V12_11655 [Candidatus Hydrogenedentota bacterium]
MKKLATLYFTIICGALLASAQDIYQATVFSPENKMVTDPQTGAELIFLTTAKSTDTNLYFHDRSWLSDSSLILFTSNREQGGLMGYVVETGELVTFTTDKGPLGRATAALTGVRFYAIRGNRVLDVALEIEVSDRPNTAPSTVILTERLVCELPAAGGSTALNESCDEKHLSIGLSGGEFGDKPVILIIDIESGAIQELYRFDDPDAYHAHVQWSRTDPNMLSYAGAPQRLMLIDIREGIPTNPYKAWPDELVTHESWWVKDQILFCGGIHPKPTEDSHVKVLDIHTGEVRIIGEGAWWPDGSDAEIAQRNWWHASGSEDGRWVAADNWHGDIMLFEGKTARPRLLTIGHRTYGKGEHPHVGWDRAGKQVVFTSHLLGSPNVCVATIPEAWQQALPE